jgi:hypothetical protein
MHLHVEKKLILKLNIKILTTYKCIYWYINKHYLIKMHGTNIKIIDYIYFSHIWGGGEGEGGTWDTIPISRFCAPSEFRLTAGNFFCIIHTHTHYLTRRHLELIILHQMYG